MTCADRNNLASATAPWERLAVDGELRALRAGRIEVRVAAGPLRLRRRNVWGEWDPLLRRVSVFGVERSDRELVHTLLHELVHVVSPDCLQEAVVERIAGDWLAMLDAGLIGRVADTLRRAATPDQPLWPDPPDDIVPISA